MSEAPTAAPIEIVPFRDEYARDFERLNREWLEGFGLIEAGDLPYMEDPRGTIVAGALERMYQSASERDIA